jgi:hypothetical protein
MSELEDASHKCWLFRNVQLGQLKETAKTQTWASRESGGCLGPDKTLSSAPTSMLLGNQCFPSVPLSPETQEHFLPFPSLLPATNAIWLLTPGSHPPTCGCSFAVTPLKEYYLQFPSQESRTPTEELMEGSAYLHNSAVFIGGLCCFWEIKRKT